MSARIRTRQLTLDVPAFLQRERDTRSWLGMLFGAAFDPPKRQMLRILDGIDLDFREGDRVAILGRNGAGKSTLLRVLNRVYQPTSGEVEVSGSCQALLNMSLGFNNEATVRENIFLRGVAMGLHTSFLRGEMGPILQFAGLERKAGHRLRTLSSGQRLRLGFAISTSVQHDIMLMDEWVGTGDANFMARAKERMQSRVSGSRIVVLASHSVGLLRDVCNKGILLEGGKLVFSGDITASLAAYHELLAKVREANSEEDLVPPAESSHVIGAVEQIESAGEGHGFLLRGWMIDDEGGIPGGIALELNGYRYAARIRSRISRGDVMRHFGLLDDGCGFEAVVEIPVASGIRDLAGVRILGGPSAEAASAPLRLAPAVNIAVSAAGSRE